MANTTKSPPQKQTAAEMLSGIESRINGIISRLQAEAEAERAFISEVRTILRKGESCLS